MRTPTQSSEFRKRFCNLDEANLCRQPVLPLRDGTDTPLFQSTVIFTHEKQKGEREPKVRS
jgi:hypothetical protein